MNCKKELHISETSCNKIWFFQQPFTKASMFSQFLAKQLHILEISCEVNQTLKNKQVFCRITAEKKIAYICN